MYVIRRRICALALGFPGCASRIKVHTGKELSRRQPEFLPMRAVTPLRCSNSYAASGPRPGNATAMAHALRGAWEENTLLPLPEFLNMRSLLSFSRRKLHFPERGERSTGEMRPPRPETVNGSVLPRSPLATVVGLSVLVVLVRSRVKVR